MEKLPQIWHSDHTSLELMHDSGVIGAAGEWFRLDVANGDARPDTIATYLSHVGQWFVWCKDNGVDPGRAAADDLKRYRGELVGRGAKHSTITLKLTTVRRFYQGAVDRGILGANPAAGIKALRDRSAHEKVKHLTAGEAELLFRAVPGDDLRSLRDRAMLLDAYDN